jgi:hypothetical protein
VAQIPRLLKASVLPSRCRVRGVGSYWACRSPGPSAKDDTMTLHSARSTTPHLHEMQADESLLVNGTLPAAILVGLGLGLAILGLSMASIWQWFSH